MSERKGMKQYPEWGERAVRGADSGGRNAEAAQQRVGNQSVQYSKLVRVTPGNKAVAISTYA